MKLNNSTATFSSILYWLSFFKKSDFFERCPSVWYHISTQVVAITIVLLSEIVLPAQHVESTWIRRGITSIRQIPNLDEFPRHFRVLFWCNFDGRKIHVTSTYFFRRNFAGREIHVISTGFFWCNFDGRKILLVSKFFYQCNFAGRKFRVVSTYFFRCNFNGRNMHVVFTYFFRRNFDGQKLDIVLGKL